MTALESIAGLDRDELVAMLKNAGAKSYRADQVFEWLYRRGATSFDEMANLPRSLREKLAGGLPLFSTKVASEDTSRDGTRKLLVELADGHSIETVMIPRSNRRTVCVSMQVGCPVRCVFCASGSAGLVRNLSTGEIVEQVLHASHGLGDEESLSHVVFMGVGEGLLNFDAFAKAISIINAPWGMNIGARRMTVSTVGMRNTIEKLAGLGLQVNLAVSLHAPNNKLRSQLIPHGQLLGVDELISQAEDYFLATGRETTYEYVLLGGVNDSPELAEELAKRIKLCHASVNLIGYNEVEGAGFISSTDEAEKLFRQTLERRGINVTTRARRGRDVEAACGQLRADALKKDDNG